MPSRELYAFAATGADHHPSRSLTLQRCDGALRCRTVYKVDTDAITLKVKQEFAAKAKAKAKKDAKAVPKAR